MKYLFGITLLIVLAPSLVCAQASAAPNDQGTVEQELVNLEREKDEAYQKGDRGALDRIYADDYVAVTANGGNATKKEILGFFVWPNTFESHRSQDLSVRIFGDTAIVTGLQKRKFYKDIKSGAEDSLRYTDVYVKRQGTWKIVAAQFTRVR